MRLIVLAVALAACVTTSSSGVRPHAVWRLALAAALRGDRAGVAGAPAPARARALSGATLAWRWWRCGAPVACDISAIEDHVTDAGYVGALPAEEQHLLSAYLRAHQGGARYEVAAESATQIGSLIVQDARPVAGADDLRRAGVHARRQALQRLIAEGKVRYAFLNSFCTHHAPRQRRRARRPRCGSARTGPTSRAGGPRQAGRSTCCPGRAVSAELRSPSAGDLRGASARAAGRIALDTEFMGEGRYRTLLCLIQLAVPAERRRRARSCWSTRFEDDLDGAALAEVLADPAIEVVVHAGRQDIALLRRRLGTEVSNVFDTQVAAGFAGLRRAVLLRLAAGGGARAAGGQERELHALGRAPAVAPSSWPTRARTSCTCSSSRASWSAAWRALGRLQWAREECEPLARSSDERDPEAIFARLPRVAGSALRPRPIARELVGWRERTAERQDRPVQSVLSDAALIEIAKRRPRQRASSSGSAASGAAGRRRARSCWRRSRAGRNARPSRRPTSTRPPRPSPTTRR